MNVIRGKREHPEEGERADGAGGTLSRRGILGGLAALPVVLYGVGSATPALATPALATPAVATAATRPGGGLTATGDLVRGAERRYNAPLLTPGTRLVLPADVKAVPIQDYYHRPHLARAESAWPSMTATDGTTVDASVIPERGAPTLVAILSGFTEGWSRASWRTTHTTGAGRRRKSPRRSLRSPAASHAMSTNSRTTTPQHSPADRRGSGPVVQQRDRQCRRGAVATGYDESGHHRRQY